MAGKKAASNPVRKERRKRSWLRGVARHTKNREANEVKHVNNLERLADLGGTIKTKTFERDGKTVTKRESPSEAVARTIREDAGWRGHVPKVEN